MLHLVNTKLVGSMDGLLVVLAVKGLTGWYRFGHKGSGIGTSGGDPQLLIETESSIFLFRKYW